MKRIITLLSMMMFAFSLSACNTMAGVGKDVERGGEKIQSSAEKAKQ